MVDFDMRESVLEKANDDSKLRVTMESIEAGSKHKGFVTRVERYGVFVKLDHSNISALAHLSECSDSFVKNISDFYDPGDRVKAIVTKVATIGEGEKAAKRIHLGLKASYFEDDEDSDSSEDSDEEGEDDADTDMESVNDDDDSILHRHHRVVTTTMKK